MWKNIPREKRNRFNLIILVALPLISFAAFIIGTKIAILMFNFQIDKIGVFFIIILLLITYINCVIITYRKLKRKGKETESTIKGGKERNIL